MYEINTTTGDEYPLSYWRNNLYTNATLNVAHMTLNQSQKGTVHKHSEHVCKG